jgi:VanZ family protein
VRLLVDERTKRVLFCLWCLTWVAVLIGSLRPGQELPFGMSDKLIHFLCYAAMTAAVAGFCHEMPGVLRWAAFVVLMGGLVEIAQHFVPTRSMDLNDFLADAAGVVGGFLLAMLWLVAVVRPLRRAAAA